MELTDNQKINLNLCCLNRNLKYGFGFIFGGILIISQILTSPPEFKILYFILSVLGIWAIFITLIYVSNRDKKFIDKKINELTSQNRRKEKSK